MAVDDMAGYIDRPYDEIEGAFNAHLDVSLQPRGPELMYELVAQLGLAQGAVVLDLGCGNGRHSVELARRFGVVVHGVDPDEAALERARRALAEGDCTSRDLGELVDFIPGLAESVPLEDESTELVWCRDVLCLVSDLDRAYAECRRVLRPRGHAIVYQMFATDHLEAREAARLFAALDCVPESMDPKRTETAARSAGLRIDECVVLGTEWGEFFEEESGKAGRLLLHAGRLLRDPDRYIGRFGRRNSGPYKVLGRGNRIVDVQRANPFIGGPPWINEVKTGGPISFATADGGSTAVYQGMKDGGLIASQRVAGSTWWLLPNLACVSGATGNFSNFLQFDEHVNLIIFKCDRNADGDLYYEFESNAYPVDAQEVFPAPPFQFDNSCPGLPSFVPVSVSTR